MHHPLVICCDTIGYKLPSNRHLTIWLYDISLQVFVISFNYLKHFSNCQAHDIAAVGIVFNVSKMTLYHTESNPTSPRLQLQARYHLYYCRMFYDKRKKERTFFWFWLICGFDNFAMFNICDSEYPPNLFI